MRCSYICRTGFLRLLRSWICYIAELANISKLLRSANEQPFVLSIFETVSLVIYSLYSEIANQLECVWQVDR